MGASEMETLDLDSDIFKIKSEDNLLSAHPYSSSSVTTGYQTSGRFHDNYEPLTPAHIKQVAAELGLITLSWPPLPTPTFEGRKNWPKSYTTNSNKEKLLLLATENFRQQFINLYPQRRPLCLAVDNECGLQKMVCTTIRPTALPYVELKDWKSCAQFVADFIDYEPLVNPTLIPDRLMSPATVFKRQKGNAFEMATCLCSLLLATGYNAYVVSGTATRDITMRILWRTNCPIEPISHEEVVEEEEELENRYSLRSIRDLRSKFHKYLEQREIDKIEEQRERQREQKRREMEELEKPPPDDLHGWRIHAWVALLPPNRDIAEVTFIEPSTAAVSYEDSPYYLSIDSIWNDVNYWVNIQKPRESYRSFTKFDLRDLKCWEHLLVGEPFDWRRPPPDDFESVAMGLDEKHLDMPASWSEPIEIAHEALTMRFPGGQRTTKYKRVICQQFGEYIMMDGLRYRLTFYSDLECMNPVAAEEYYENRRDCLTSIYVDLQSKQVTEYFKLGREGACKMHWFNSEDCGPESHRRIEYYHTSRIDGLKELEMHPLFLKEYFVGREDRLYYRYARYAQRGKPPKGMVEGTRRIVMNVIERFERDPSKPAHEDIAEQEFALVNNEIRIKYHYASGNVTASTRTFIKPPVDQLGENLKFNPDLTSGYLADVTAKQQSPLELFYLLQKMLENEEKTLYHLREIEDEVAQFGRLRAIESAVTHLDVSLFNREQNEDYKIGMKEKEQQLKLSKARETDEETDYLAPYIMRAGPGPYTRSQCEEIRESCLTDFRNLLLSRAQTLQERFSRELQAVMKAQEEYEAKIGDMTREEEEKYLVQFTKNKYALTLLEIRLQRHKDLSPHRYKALEKYLQYDKRLRPLIPPMRSEMG